jgi:hypothetical protein
MYNTHVIESLLRVWNTRGVNKRQKPLRGSPKICESLEGAPRDPASSLARSAFTPLTGPQSVTPPQARVRNPRVEV